jgi:protein-tyrosine phosphatase
LGFVDLHSHVLPGLDDGSPDPETSLQMLRGLRTLGFEVVCATPHQKTGHFLPERSAIRAAHEGLVASAAAAAIDLRIPLGAENMWDATFYERLESDTIPAYDDGPAFLVELPIAELPVGLFERIFELRRRGRLPVLAHPERYRPLWAAPDLVDKLGAECALVVDLGAVAGYHGRGEAKAARRMLREGRVHAVASDAHSPSDVRVAAEGIAWIRKKLGEETVTALLCDNPRRILAGEHPGG